MATATSGRVALFLLAALPAVTRAARTDATVHFTSGGVAATAAQINARGCTWISN